MEPYACLRLVQVLVSTLAEAMKQFESLTYSALALLRQSLLAPVLRLLPFIISQSMLRCIWAPAMGHSALFQWYTFVVAVRFTLTGLLL
jgi:hypothetical protein